MPFKLWKREKPAKEKGKAEEEEEKPRPAKGDAATAKQEPAAPKGAEKTAAPAAPREPGPAAAQLSPEEIDAVVAEVHAGLVDLGLTIPGTKAVFAKRVAQFPGGPAEFVATYRERAYRAGTAVLASWLGFTAPLDFEPTTFLADVNLRLSSFKLNIQMGDLSWLDQELGLRKARLRVGDQERVVRFKDARDFIKGVNDLVAPKKLVFLELETWTNDHAFLLVREPKWDKLAATTLVVVKAPQTAVGGECGECGAPVGTNWHDCLSCGAVFGTD